MNLTRKYFSLFVFVVLLSGSGISQLSLAGGWDLDKGPNVSTIQGKLVCIGCSLMGGVGSNSQCGTYTTHNIGLRMGDGSLWHFVNNQTGHDIIFAHNLLDGKKATITGFMYPIAHMIEIVSINIDGVTDEQVSEAAYKEDQLIGKALLERKKGEAPVITHYMMPE